MKKFIYFVFIFKGAGNEGSSEMEVDKENNDKGSESGANVGKGASAEEVSNQASPKDVGGISDSQESVRV